MEPADVSDLFDSLSGHQVQRPDGAGGGSAHLSHLHGQVRVLDAGRGHLECVAVVREDRGQLEAVCGTTAGQGQPESGGVRLDEGKKESPSSTTTTTKEPYRFLTLTF